MSDKYHRLVTFVVDICPKPLRELFVTNAKADQGAAFTTLDSYLHSRKSDIENLRHHNKITDDQYVNIYPSNGCVDINQWDITLLTVLLKELFRRQLQQTEFDHIYVIKSIRNSLQHIANSGLVDDNTFNTLWSNLKGATIALSQCADSAFQQMILEEINAALTENMPNLGHVLRMWNSVMYVQLQLQNARVETKLDLQASDIKSVKEKSLMANKILNKTTVKRKGRNGVPEKRIKIVDNKVERMRETLARGLREENDSIKTNKEDIKDITEQLSNNHRVIVTGFDKQKIYKCALAAVKEINYERTDQCLEINNPSDWKRVGFEDARVVLFREPFGRSYYDAQKVEVMLEEFDNMLNATDESNDDVIDIVIVAYQTRLNEVLRQHEHDMLLPASTVYIDSTGDNDAGEICATDYTVLGNLMEHSKLYKKRYKLKNLDNQVKEKAENTFMKHNVVVIVGSTESGKTSRSFHLLSSYDLSNGEENFLVLMEPDEMKYVKFSLRPVLIMKLLAGVEFDSVEAKKWYRHFDAFYAAVQENKVAIISIMDAGVFRTWQTTMPSHPLLEHVVYTDDGSKQKKKTPVKVTSGLSTSGTQTDQASNSNGIGDNVIYQRVRAVKSIRSYNIKGKDDERNCRILGCCVLPTGETLLVDNNIRKLKKLNVNYELISECDLPGYLCDLCYTGNNEAIVAMWYRKLQFVNVTGSMALTRSIHVDHHCESVACHGNLLYVIDSDSVYVYTADGKYQNRLYTTSDTDDTECYYIAVSNDGGMIYIADREKSSLITINSSGHHEYTLNGVTNQLIPLCLCVDDEGHVYVISTDEDDADKSVIVQVSSDGRQKLGTVFELDGVYRAITFDRGKSTLLVAGVSNKIKVLKLQR